MLHILSKQTNKQTKQKQISQLIKLRLEPVTINQVSIGWQEKKRFSTETCEISWCGQN